MLSKLFSGSDGALNVSFGYQCTGSRGDSCEVSEELSTGISGKDVKIRRNASSFSCLSGAALSANFTLANTTICNGLIGSGILPELDSPKKFRSVSSSSSLSSLDILSSSLQNSTINSNGYLSSQSECSDYDTNVNKATSAPSRTEGFLKAVEVQMAGGPAGEDRVQAVCSEENGWLFCAIYDGFNGRDAADFLAGTLYENIRHYLKLLDSQTKQKNLVASNGSCVDPPLRYFSEGICLDEEYCKGVDYPGSTLGKKEVATSDSFRLGALDSLQQALAQAENDFLCMVEKEMDIRPDLVSIGSCVLVVLLHGRDLYTLGLGDSRAVLATSKRVNMDKNERLEAIQLNDSHSIDNEMERLQILLNHPDDPKTIVHGRVKGKLRLTRAFGVGYLKKKKLNDALMGILKVQNLLSPPYVTAGPSLNIHRVSECDQFVIVASDGLFDFFSNEEAVELVHSYILSNPFGSSAKFLLEQLILRASERAGLSMEELMEVPAGRRRKYHDDVTIIIILLGSDQRTSTASTHL